MDEHRIHLKELYDRTNSSFNGLSSEEARKRLVEYGSNIIEEKKYVSLIVKYLKNFTNFFAILLMTGSVLALIAEYLSPGEGNLYIGIALFVVVILNSTFTFIQEYQSEKIMQSFKKMMPTKIQVLRDGRRKEILAEELVPGDIIFLSEGDKVPADARLIEHHALKVDNSSLTGESEPQLRSLECTHDNILESRNMIFSGTLVQTGTGTAIVYSTGMKTQIGRIAQLTKETEETITPMRKEINHFIKIISSIAIILGVAFFFLSFALGNRLMGSLIFAIGIIVANVPEGLLPTVTLSLSMASKKMAKHNALIKNLESVETLGSTTVICTDKTGTITQNKMFVNSLFLNMTELNHSEDFSNIDGFDKVIGVSVLCNNSKLDKFNEKYLGDPTEGALLMFTEAYADIDKLNKEHPRIDEQPFDSNTKCMITANKSGKKTFSYLKGAPEIVLEKCDYILLNNKLEHLDQNFRTIIKHHYDKMSSRGERVLALAFKNEEKSFIFVGLVGIIDPPRPEIAEAISKCKEASIKVIMVTGDYSLTAEAIANMVGMSNDGSVNAITGSELNNISDEELKELLKKQNLVFARTTPIQKLRIVQTLQSNGEVVAVTGDGVNDAPALKNADIGISMGLMGTEVAKEASNMVLLDDNFSTIVHAVEQGRTIYSNIKKFITYILTSNVPQILPFIAFVLLGIPLPLTVVLILAIDLGTDLLPALGLGKEKAESDVMKYPPRSRKERLLTRQLLIVSYGIIGVLQAIAGFFSYFVVLFMGGWTFGESLAFNDPLYLKAVTAFFASIVICQIPDVLVCRTRKQSLLKQGLFSNGLVWLGIFTELLLLSVIVFVPFANKFFGTHSLSFFELSLSLPFALLILLFGEFRKFLIRKENLFVNKYLKW
ncbi:ATPase [Candidatus Woesearchaeota archaeon]|jgi:sodium/potassium-transporting ATPase subunit alpha|nr:ATPase [Candidatus Woesearchaeota archaeon]|tara:strand:+ start:2340 stop:5006 length:2667 start_codon:yes stop_codon:yes gene_type:complete